MAMCGSVQGMWSSAVTEKEHEGVYAILRHDPWLDSLESAVTVKQIVRTLEIAEADVARLNDLNGHKGSRYWWQYTRLFPDGTSAGSDAM